VNDMEQKVKQTYRVVFEFKDQEFSMAVEPNCRVVRVMRVVGSMVKLQ